MYLLTSQQMIREIINSLPLQSGLEFDWRVRQLLERQLFLLVRLSKREQVVEMERRVAILIAQSININKIH